jgi:hypothetical protein
MARSGIEFNIDIRPFERLIARSPQAAGKGAEKGMDDIKDEWIVKSRNIAPLDTGNLRRQIDGTARAKGIETEVVVTGNATSRGSGRFNYGYYIHEEDAGGKQLRTPGTEKRFLAKVGEENQQDWAKKLEREIEAELRRAGW